MHEPGLVSKQERKLIRALGLMSGTSMDGIDVALVETDGEYEVMRGHGATYPYSAAFRTQLRAGLADAKTIAVREERPGRLRLLEQYLTELHAEAVCHYLEDHGVAPSSVGLIGFHGQTVLHRPEAGLTVQLGDGLLLAKLTGIDVVFDLRAADVAAGGQGAPLAPVYHMALAANHGRPIAVVNIGGVANVTWIGDGALSERSLIAFDAGPGNALIDDWMRLRTGEELDVDGAYASRGKIHEPVLKELLAHPYFSAPPPKSLDRNAFSLDAVSPLSLEDGAATLTAFTAFGIAAARRHIPALPKLWIIAGGGRRNKTLMTMLAACVESPVVAAEAAGFDGSSVEAEAWAYLAVRSVKRLPITFPGTTGAPRSLTGGVFFQAPRPWK